VNAHQSAANAPTNVNAGANAGANASVKAAHGYRNEVSWDGGNGRQPYGNRERENLPAAAHEEPGGDRGERSGRALEQLEQARRKP